MNFIFRPKGRFVGRLKFESGFFRFIFQFWVLIFSFRLGIEKIWFFSARSRKIFLKNFQAERRKIFENFVAFYSPVSFCRLFLNYSIILEKENWKLWKLFNEKRKNSFKIKIVLFFLSILNQKKFLDFSIKFDSFFQLFRINEKKNIDFKFIMKLFIGRSKNSNVRSKNSNNYEFWQLN